MQSVATTEVISGTGAGAGVPSRRPIGGLSAKIKARTESMSVRRRLWFLIDNREKLRKGIVSGDKLTVRNMSADGSLKKEVAITDNIGEEDLVDVLSLISSTGDAFGKTKRTQLINQFKSAANMSEGTRIPATFSMAYPVNKSVLKQVYDGKKLSTTDWVPVMTSVTEEVVRDNFRREMIGGETRDTIIETINNSNYPIDDLGLTIGNIAGNDMLFRNKTIIEYINKYKISAQEVANSGFVDIQDLDDLADRDSVVELYHDGFFQSSAGTDVVEAVSATREIEEEETKLAEGEPVDTEIVESAGEQLVEDAVHDSSQPSLASSYESSTSPSEILPEMSEISSALPPPSEPPSSVVSSEGEPIAPASSVASSEIPVPTAISAPSTESVPVPPAISDPGSSIGEEEQVAVSPEGVGVGDGEVARLAGEATIVGEGVKRFHKEAISIYFGSLSNPSWDKTLLSDRANRWATMDRAKMKKIALRENRGLAKKLGEELLLEGDGENGLFTNENSDIKDIVLENFEIIQLFFAYGRGMAKGDRMATAKVPIGSLMQFRTALAGQGNVMGEIPRAEENPYVDAFEPETIMGTQPRFQPADAENGLVPVDIDVDQPAPNLDKAWRERKWTTAGNQYVGDETIKENRGLPGLMVATGRIAPQPGTYHMPVQNKVRIVPEDCKGIRSLR